jgi:hypothetical protein
VQTNVICFSARKLEQKEVVSGYFICLSLIISWSCQLSTKNVTWEWGEDYEQKWWQPRTFSRKPRYTPVNTDLCLSRSEIQIYLILAASTRSWVLLMRIDSKTYCKKLPKCRIISLSVLPLLLCPTAESNRFDILRNAVTESWVGGRSRLLRISGQSRVALLDAVTKQRLIEI